MTQDAERPKSGRAIAATASSSTRTVARPRSSSSGSVTEKSRTRGASKAARPRNLSRYAALRFTYRKRPRLRVGEVQLRLDHIIDLVVLAGDDLLSEPYDLASIDMQIERARESVRTGTPVVRLHYNPVLEISIAAGVAAAAGIIALWKKYSLARIEASKADTAEAKARVANAKADTAVARQELDQDLIEGLRDDLQTRRLRRQLDPLMDPTLDELLYNAAQALILPKKIEGVDKNGTAIEM